MANHAFDIGVKKKVAKVISALHGWSHEVFDPVMFPAAVCDPQYSNSQLIQAVCKVQVLFQRFRR
jgi:hypothetical protein